jgi:hypothetical protein
MPPKPPPPEPKEPQEPKGTDRNARRGAAATKNGKDDAEIATWSQGEGSAGMGKKVMPMLVTDKYAATTIPELTMWDPSTVKLDGTIVAIGKRRTGKSFAFRHILHCLKSEFAAGICISQTDELNKYWQQYMPKKYIFNRFAPEILLAVFARQKAILNDKRYTEEENEKRARFFIILDDVISDPKIRYDPCIAELFVAGRHYKLFVMITTQYGKAITPTLRSNADYVLILNNKQEGQREALWRDFADFMTKEGFYTLMDAYTEDNEILIVDTSNPTAKPWEILHWFKADDPGEFKLGNKEYWDGVVGSQRIPNEHDTMMSSARLVNKFSGDEE